MKKIGAYSYIRITACIAVVALHAIFSTEHIYADVLSDRAMILSDLFVNNLMWAVPCFVMVSGALLLEPERDISIKKIWTSYIRRMLVALVVCCCLFRLIDAWMNQEVWSLQLIPDMLYELVTGSSWSHLWYLYMMIGLYLLLPIYRLIAKYASVSLMRYLIGMYFLFLSVLPLMNIMGLASGFYIHVLTIYPFFMFVGYALSHDILRVNIMGGVICFLAGTVMISVCSVLNLYIDPDLKQVWAYASPAVLLQSVGIFVWFQKIAPDAGKLASLVDQSSFTIYLVHMIWIRMVLRILQWNPYDYGVIGFLALIVGSFLLSFAIDRLWNMLPHMDTNRRKR